MLFLTVSLCYSFAIYFSYFLSLLLFFVSQTQLNFVGVLSKVLPINAPCMVTNLIFRDSQ